MATRVERFFHTRSIVRSVCIFSIAWLSGSMGPFAVAQESFQLVVGNSGAASKAEKNDQELIIRDSNGGVSRYVRDPRMDSQDGGWLGFTSRAARQVIRWPIANQGKMQIGSLDGSGQIQFRESKMSIVPVIDPRIAPPKQDPLARLDPVLPGDGSRPGMHRDRDGLLQPIRDEDLAKPMSLRLANRADHQNFLSLMPDGSFSMMGQGADQGMDWMMVPVGNGLVRFQTQQANRLVALRSDPRTRRLSIANITNDVSQLWRWQTCPQTAGGYILESVLFPGQVLAFQGGQMLLQPMGFGPQQQWYPVFPNIAIEPTFRNVSSRVDPNPPLPPATIDFTNSHSEAIFVLLADKRASGNVQTIRIPAGEVAQVQLERDAGSTIVESHEVVLPNGLWDRRDITYAIPPAILYDVSVYVEFLQSIAIDRTGKNPNPIEDINYQPKSLGWFDIPPGDRLPEQGSIDLYAQAKGARNPGAVRPFDRELLEKKKLPSEDPLRSLLREFQGQRAAF